MEQASNYDLAWENEEQNLATKSIAKIWLLAAIIIPFFALLEIQAGIQQVLSFLYLALPLSFLLLFSVAFHKKMKLPPAVMTYSVSVLIALLFSYMASKTQVQNVHNYILGVSCITLVRGVLYFGRAKNLMVVTAINHAMALAMIVLIRHESIFDMPNILSAYLFSIIFIVFSYVGMKTRYFLTKEIFITSLKLKDSYTEIEEKNKSIIDSINYARRLQDAILPPLKTIKESLPDSFVLYQPKDIVAGDFYWMWGETTSRHSSSGEVQEDLILIAAADSTGHGIPGAMVSVVCSNALNRTVKEFQIKEPGKILDKVRELVLETFEKSEENVQDGMDISLCSINTKTLEVQYSGAYNSLWYIRNGEMKELAADKQPIGKFDNPTNFKTHTLQLAKGDTLYLLTDGYPDQFGGEKGKKFRYKQLKDLLMDNKQLTMEQQKTVLEETLSRWKGSLEQVDDILVIGIRI
jgi:serine phosphatase RsbU (regulator of sigma subunit)